MSSYTTNGTVITAIPTGISGRLALAEAAVARARAVGALDTWCASSRLAQLAGTSITDVTTLQQTYAAVGNTPLAGHLVREAATAELCTANRLRDAAVAASSHGDDTTARARAREAGDHLRRALATTGSRLADEERHLVTEATRVALMEMGHAVRVHVGSRSAGIVGERGHGIAAVLVGPGGTLQLDNAGLAGGDCIVPMRELEAALARQGIRVKLVRRTDHGDERGGTLIRRAARADVHDLSRGLVLQDEAGAEIGIESAETDTKGGRIDLRQACP